MPKPDQTVKWTQFNVGSIYFDLPSNFRRMKSGVDFGGRVIPASPKTYVNVLIQEVVQQYEIDIYRHETHQPPVSVEHGPKNLFHARGESSFVLGAVEIRLEGIPPSPESIRCHRWDMFLPLGGTWAGVIMMALRGGLTWKEFEDFGKTVIRSCRRMSR